MTTMQGAAGVIPEWDQADRMRKALRVAGLQVQQMAKYLGVSRVTVGTWINGRIAPSTQTVRLWAIRCGVSYEWLCGDGDDEGVRREGIEPPTRWLRPAAAGADLRICA